MANNSKLATSRSMFLDNMEQLPFEIQTAVNSKQQKLNDSEIYSVVALGAALTSINDLFAPDGAKVVGVRNIANQKIDAGKYFMVSGIEILYGIDIVNATGAAANFGSAPIPAAVFNGELTIEQNGRKIFSKQSMACFFTGITSTSIAVGPLTALANGRAIITLDNPQWIEPQVELKGRMEWAAAPGAASSFIKIRLIGTVNERS